MGYRSDVRIVTSKKGYNELKKSIQEYYKENVDNCWENGCEKTGQAF